jgi:hypothetical protein
VKSKIQTESEIAGQVSLRHPIEDCGAHVAGGSLEEVLFDAPTWWTPTAKAKTKAIAGIALGIRFAHG